MKRKPIGWQSFNPLNSSDSLKETGSLHLHILMDVLSLALQAE